MQAELKFNFYEEIKDMLFDLFMQSLVQFKRLYARFTLLS